MKKSIDKLQAESVQVLEAALYLSGWRAQVDSTPSQHAHATHPHAGAGRA